MFEWCRGRIKVLPLEFWMDMVDDKFTHHTEIPPVFQRAGLYYYRGRVRRVWFEYQGRAWVGNLTPADFEYTLALYNHRPLTGTAVKAIKDLQRQGIRYEKVDALLNFDRQWKDIRNTGRDSRKTIMRIIRRVDAALDKGTEAPH